MQPINIIGFGGRRKHGKTEASNGVMSAFRSAHPFAFATEIKRIAGFLYQLTHEQLHGDLKEVLDERWGLTPREIMTRLGDGVGREIHPLTWIRTVERSIQQAALISPFGSEFVAVVTDVRRPNEVEAIRSWGGLVVKVVRDHVSQDHDRFGAHASETEVDLWEGDFQIENNGTVEELHRNAAAIAKFVLSPAPTEPARAEVPGTYCMMPCCTTGELPTIAQIDNYSASELGEDTETDGG